MTTSLKMSIIRPPRVTVMAKSGMLTSLIRMARWAYSIPVSAAPARAHHKTVARVARVIEGAVEIAGIRQAENGPCPRRGQDGLGPAHDQFPGAHVDPDRPGDSAVVHEQIEPHGPVDDKRALLSRPFGR